MDQILLFIKYRIKNFIIFLFPLIIFSIILYGRLNTHIFDTGCPTYLANMIWKLHDQGFPATFLGAPQIAANYHQLPLIAASILTGILSIHPIEALSILLFSSGILLFILASFVAKEKYKSYLVPWILLIFITSASIPLEFTQSNVLIGESLSWHSYVGILDHLSGSTWSIGLIFLLLIIWLHNRKYGFHLSIFSLSFLIITNPTIFTIAIISILIFEFLNSKKSILKVIALITLYYLSKHIPSVFLSGENYAVPVIFLRIFSDAFISNIIDVVKYTPLITLCILPLAIYNLYTKHNSLVEYILIFSILFPIFFGFNNIDDWDNKHKFIILAIFVSFFVFINFIKIHNNKNILILLVFINITSIPALYNMYKTRIDITNIKMPIKYYDVGDPKLLKFLGDYKNTMLWPYPSDLNKCVYFKNIHTNSSVSIAGFYFDNFLLSNDYEERIKIESKWYRNNYNIKDKYSNYKNFIIIPNDKMDNFLVTEKKFLKVAKFFFL